MQITFSPVICKRILQAKWTAEYTHFHAPEEWMPAICELFPVAILRTSWHIYVKARVQNIWLRSSMFSYVGPACLLFVLASPASHPSNGDVRCRCFEGTTLLETPATTSQSTKRKIPEVRNFETHYFLLLYGNKNVGLQVWTEVTYWQQWI